MLRFVSHTISIATTQPRFSSVKTAIDNTQTGVAMFQQNIFYKNRQSVDLAHRLEDQKK